MAVDTEKLAELIAMLSAITVEEGVSIFDHSAEEFGLEVMENHSAILAALRRVAEPVGLAELTLHCITSADPGAQSEQTLAHDMAMMARQAVERLNQGRAALEDTRDGN